MPSLAAAPPPALLRYRDAVESALREAVGEEPSPLVAAARYVGTNGEIYVIYRGLVAEKATTDDIILRPQHPYTQALLSAVPVLKGIEAPGEDRFIPLKQLDQNEQTDAGCLFASRCPFAKDICKTERPLLKGQEHDYACHFPVERHVVATQVEA